MPEIPINDKLRRNRKRRGEAAPAAGHPRGTETLLLAEHDEESMAAIKTTLEACGYGVVEAPYGKYVVERFLEHKDRIRLVLCEDMMPGMSGAEIERAVRAEAPDVPILFMSGFVGERPPYEKARIIFKPFTAGVLLRRVRDLLDGKQ